MQALNIGIFQLAAKPLYEPAILSPVYDMAKPFSLQPAISLTLLLGVFDFQKFSRFLVTSNV
jgi:hypothetical protein